MSTQPLDYRVPGFADYIARRQRSRLWDDKGAPRYAHPIDEWVLRSLKVVPVGVIEKAIDTHISVFYGRILAQSIFIDQKSFPDLFEVVTHCAESLDIPIPHAVAGESLSLFNAMTAGTSQYSFIYVTSGLCRYFTPEQAAFVVGHECGHIAAQHVVYHTVADLLLYQATQFLGPLARYVSLLPRPLLLAWVRRSEITADRAGLLACGDIKVAERALLRLIAGHADADQVDIDDYLQKYRETQEYHGNHTWWQLFTTHPYIPQRIEALRLFAQSELYHELSAKPRPDAPLLNTAELNRRVNLLVQP